MSSDRVSASPRQDGTTGAVFLLEGPTTPLDIDVDAPPVSSQVTLPSTEGPPSPIDIGASFKTEINDDRLRSASVIPSSLTPPPSSQAPVNGASANLLGYMGSQRSAILSPPVTGLSTSIRREAPALSDYAAPSPSRVVEASPDELRAMLQSCIAEQAKLKMETAHHKLQYSLLSMQADEDAKRAAVEHEMTRREVEALRMAEHARQARRELSAAADPAQTKYSLLKADYEKVVEENILLQKKVKSATKWISRMQQDVNDLTEEKGLLLNRLRENREHFHLLCSPGGMFHGALTPKTQALSTPLQPRATPRQTPKSATRESRHERNHSQQMAALLQALSQENNSAPSTPTTSHRPAPRNNGRHVRNVQSMSSLPTTPISRPPGEYGGLLPPLVPQSEPRHRQSRFLDTPVTDRESGRKSRESTISAEDDNAELARQAVAVASFASRGSRGSRSSHRHPADEDAEDEVFESQASQAASEMLRRDPRESFEVASSVGGSRDGTPAPAEKSSRLQAKLFAGLNKNGMAAEKRKFSGGTDGADDGRRDVMMSPTKKLRVAGGLREPKDRVGLGIQYSQEV